MSELRNLLWTEFKNRPWPMIWAITQIIIVIAVNVAIVVLAIYLPG